MRPCQHRGHVEECPYCRWCVLPGPKAAAYRRLWGEPGPPPLKPAPGPCRHLGPATGETGRCVSCGRRGEQIPLYECKKYGKCHKEQGAMVAGAVRCGEVCEGYEPPPPRPLMQLVSTYGGIGDALLSLTVAAGMRRAFPGREIVLGLPNTAGLPWAALFDGCDRAVSPPLAHVLTAHTNEGRSHSVDGPEGRWNEYAAAAGVRPELPSLKPLPHDALEWAEAYRGAVALAPWSHWESRTWPLDRWLDLEEKLIASGRRCVVLDSERDRNRRFRSQVLAREDPRRVAAVLLASAGLVGNDSGLMHLAGLLRVRGLALCGPTPGERIFGFYPTVRWLHAMSGSLADVTADAALAAWDDGPFTYLTDAKLAALRRAVAATGGVPGAMAELGVYRGGSALAMARADRTRRTLHLFDTFAGLPSDDPEGPHKAGDHKAGESEVREALAGFPAAFHAGTFPATAAGLENERYSLVHIDANLYDATRDAIAYFWPRLSPGGRLVFDDWLWERTPGVTRAIREAFRPEQIEQTAEHQCQVAKPARRAVVSAFWGQFKTLEPLFSPSQRRYAASVGADYVLLPEPGPRLHVHYGKWALRDVLARYDRVLWLDGDAAVNDGAPDVFDLVPENAVGLFNEVGNHDAARLGGVVARGRERLGLPPAPLTAYYNTGIFVASARHAGLFRPPEVPLGESWPEQTHFNLRLSATDVFPLDWRWNCMASHQARKAEAYFVHYSDRPLADRRPG